MVGEAECRLPPDSRQFRQLRREVVDGSHARMVA
jgi:hypothetical protein